MASYQPLKVESLDQGMISAYPVTILPQDRGFTRMMFNFDFDEIPGVVRKRYGVTELYDELPGPCKGSYQFLKDGIEPFYITAVADTVLSADTEGAWSEIQFDGEDAVSASLTLQGVTYTAATAGVGGNSYSVTIVQGTGVSIALSGTIDEDGKVVITLGTDAEEDPVVSNSGDVAGLAFTGDGVALISISLETAAVEQEVAGAALLSGGLDSKPAWNDDTAASCSFESLLGLLVVSDGVNQPFRWDGTAATQLEHMPKAKYLCELRGRLFGAGIDGDPLALRASHVGDPTRWDVDEIGSNAFLIYPGGDGAITAIANIEDIVLIGKKYSLHMLVGTSVHDFQVIPIDDTIGIGSHWTVQNIRGAALFVSSEGEVFRIEAGGRPERLSGPIQDIIRTVNTARIGEARAAVMEKYHYVVTLPVGGSSFITLIYDIIKRRWRVSDLNIGTSAVSAEILGYCFSYPNGKQLYNIDPDNNMDYRDGRTYIIPAYIETMEYHCGLPEAEKEINNLWIGVWQGDKPFTLFVEAKRDAGEWENVSPLGVEVPVGKDLYKRVKVPIGRNCYNIQFRITNEGLDEPVRILDIILSFIAKEVE